MALEAAQQACIPKFVVTVGGDAGGGGSDTRLDYQVVELLGYKLKKVTLQGGWRYSAIHKTPAHTAFVNLAMTGVPAAFPDEELVRRPVSA